MGKAYAAAGQAGAACTQCQCCRHTRLIAEGLRPGSGLPPEAVAELRRTTDQAPGPPSKQLPRLGSWMATMVVATERHLWVNLADIGEKEKHFLLDAPVYIKGLISLKWKGIRGSRSGWCCFAHNVSVAGILGWFAEGLRPGSGAPLKR